MVKYLLLGVSALSGVVGIEFKGTIKKSLFEAVVEALKENRDITNEVTKIYKKVNVSFHEFIPVASTVAKAIKDGEIVAYAVVTKAVAVHVVIASIYTENRTFVAVINSAPNDAYVLKALEKVIHRLVPGADVEVFVASWRRFAKLDEVIVVVPKRESETVNMFL